MGKVPGSFETLLVAPVSVWVTFGTRTGRAGRICLFSRGLSWSNSLGVSIGDPGKFTLDPAPSWIERGASSVLVEDADPDPVLAWEDDPVLAGETWALLVGGGEPVLAGVEDPLLAG